MLCMSIFSWSYIKRELGLDAYMLASTMSVGRDRSAHVDTYGMISIPDKYWESMVSPLVVGPSVGDPRANVIELVVATLVLQLSALVALATRSRPPNVNKLVWAPLTVPLYSGRGLLAGVVPDNVYDF